MKPVLSAAQVEQYERQGFLFPLDVLSAREVSDFRAEIERLEEYFGGKMERTMAGETHLHFRWAQDLSTHPAILDIVEEIIGHNILVHSTTIFSKAPNDSSYVSWHQDACYWGLSAPRLVSAWVALSDSTVDNGCMRVIPQSHKKVLPHMEKPHADNMLGSGATVQRAVDQTRAVDLVLRRGQISLHHSNIIHGSQPNRSGVKRIAFAIRYVAPDVTQSLRHHAVLLARGRDECRNYQLAEDCPAADFRLSIAAHTAFTQRIQKLRESQRRAAR